MKKYSDVGDANLAEVESAFSEYVNEYGSDEVAPELIAESVGESCSLDHWGSLKNGDILTVEWNLDDEDVKFLEKAFNIKLKYNNFSVKVSGLKEAKTVDLFKDINVAFEGADSDGTILVTLGNGNMWNDITYSCDKTAKLSNGDQVTVTLEGYDNDLISALTTNYGVIPKETSKKYTVEGLGRYISSVNDIPAETMKQMQDVGKKYFEENAIQDWTNLAKFDGADYLGNCFIVRTENSVSDSDYYASDINAPENAIYLVYKVGVTIEREDYFHQIVFYSYLKYSDLTTYEKENCKVDLSNYTITENTFAFNPYFSDDWGDAYVWYFNGYETLDELLSAIDNDKDNYSIINNVTDGDTEVNKKQAEAVEKRSIKINGKVIDNGIGEGKKYNGHYYIVYNNDSFETYNDAEKYCENMGGHLISIADEDENKFVADNLISKGYYYIGLTDDNKKGEFEWSDGTKIKYKNWHEGKPDYFTWDYEHYVLIYSDGTWDDWTWEHDNYYIICEFDTLPD